MTFYVLCWNIQIAWFIFLHPPFSHWPPLNNNHPGVGGCRCFENWVVLASGRTATPGKGGGVIKILKIFLLHGLHIFHNIIFAKNCIFCTICPADFRKVYFAGLYRELLFYQTTGSCAYNTFLRPVFCIKSCCTVKYEAEQLAKQKIKSFHNATLLCWFSTFWIFWKLMRRRLFMVGFFLVENVWNMRRVCIK